MTVGNTNLACRIEHLDSMLITTTEGAKSALEVAENNKVETKMVS